MRTHATAQLIGGRSHQCDATATYTHQGTRAYALLDGIGSTEDVQTWTRMTARRLARAAARTGALEGLRAVHAARAAEVAAEGYFAEYMSKAVAVVAVTAPGKEVEVAWCGDSRAYLLPTATEQPVRLTTDHNHRQQLLDMDLEPGPYARNVVTSYLGDTSEYARFGSVTVPNHGRLVLASDGTYEPLEDAGVSLADYLEAPLSGWPEIWSRLPSSTPPAALTTLRCWSQILPGDVSPTSTGHRTIVSSHYPDITLNHQGRSARAFL